MAKAKRPKKRRPRCLLIAGPNGAGKTTFAREYLPNDARVLNFVNADLIASGLSPLRPELAAVAGARLMLAEVDRLVERQVDFAWESTLSGLGHVKRIETMKQRVLPAGMRDRRRRRSVALRPRPFRATGATYEQNRERSAGGFGPATTTAG